MVGISVAAYRWEARQGPAICQICGRDIPEQTAYRLQTSEGTIRACCPSCAMHYMLHHPNTVRQAWASDFVSGRMIPAGTAYYDEGGDVQYCTASNAPIEREPQGIRVRVYDRCLPTLVAFASRDEAESYRRKHGGRILTYNEALESVRAQ
jgi:hypothetical protein